MKPDNSRLLINKSHPSIHFTLDPKVSMTGAAAKGLNALLYAMQRQARSLSSTVQEYHDTLGDGNTSVLMPMSEFAKLTGLKTRNYAAFRKTVNEMGDMKVTWSNGVDGKGGSFGFHNLFVRAEVKDNIIEFVIPPESREMFVNDNNVAVIDFLKVAEGLTSKYAIFLHDLIEEQMQGELHSLVALEFENDVLRNALKVPFDMANGSKTYSYLQPSRFIDKVLKKAVSEYNAAGMKYHIVNFSHRNVGEIWTIEVIPHALNAVRQFEQDHSDELFYIITTMKSFGINEQKRTEILNSVSNEKRLEYISYCAEVTKNQKSVTSEKKGGYFLTVIKNNEEAFEKIWEGRRREREIEFETNRRDELRKVEKQKEDHRNKYQKNKVDNFLAGQDKSSDEFKDLLTEFVEYLVSTRHPFHRKYKASIDEGTLPNGEDGFFRSFVLSKLQITDDEIDDYVRRQSIKIEV